MRNHWLLHRHIIAFPRFLDRRLLFCRITACLLFIFIFVYSLFYLFIIVYSVIFQF